MDNQSQPNSYVSNANASDTTPTDTLTPGNDPPDQIQTVPFDPVNDMAALVGHPELFTSLGGHAGHSIFTGNENFSRVATIVFIYDASFKIENCIAEWVEGTGLVTVRLPYSSVPIDVPATDQTVNTSLSARSLLAYTHVHIPHKNEDVEEASNVLALTSHFMLHPATFTQFLSRQPSHRMHDMDQNGAIDAASNPQFGIPDVDNKMGFRLIVQKIYAGPDPVPDTQICGKGAGRIPMPGLSNVTLDTVWLTKYFMPPNNFREDIIAAGDEKFKKILKTNNLL